MPQGASEIAGELFLRLLVMGPPKAGKTQTCVTTCEGPVLLINCDDKGAIRPAARNWKRKDGGLGAIAGDEFDIEHVEDLMGMERAITVARKGVKRRRYNTVIVDPITTYAGNIEVQLADSTNESGKGPDGRRYWPEYTKRLKNTIARLFRLEAHVIVTAHYLDVGGETIEGQAPKIGAGIVPMLSGKARSVIPAMFQDVVFFEKRGNKRVFVTGIDGVWGPGCRNVGAKEVPGSIKTLMKEMGIAKIGKRARAEESAQAPLDDEARVIKKSGLAK
jgi:AAA domain